MKKIINPASLLLYFLSLLTFFLIGMSFAGITGVAKVEGFAGGAIIFGYGIVFSLTAFFVAILFSYFASPKTVVTANRILAVVFVILLSVIVIRFFEQKNSDIALSPGFSFPVFI